MGRLSSAALAIANVALKTICNQQSFAAFDVELFMYPLHASQSELYCPVDLVDVVAQVRRVGVLDLIPYILHTRLNVLVSLDHRNAERRGEREPSRDERHGDFSCHRYHAFLMMYRSAM